MAGVTGPISTLPGSRHKVPEGMMCDDHQDRPAVVRIQGETDSFGSEMIDFCQECLDKDNEEQKQLNESRSAKPCWCDHCNAMVNENTVPTRDPDEGTCGPVYHLCKAHRDSLADYHREDD